MNNKKETELKKKKTHTHKKRINYSLLISLLFVLYHMKC